jgi:hypothetical protein
MFIIKIIYGIAFIATWYSLIRYRRVVKWWTGNFVWAEQYLWSGGTYTALIFIGLFLIFLWVLRPFGWLELLFWAKQITPSSQQTTINWKE